MLVLFSECHFTSALTYLTDPCLTIKEKDSGLEYRLHLLASGTSIFYEKEQNLVVSWGTAEAPWISDKDAVVSKLC